ncbi:MAG: DUF4349 domain-containing protein, partial [Planctomycetaceae bacterium]|nr:DUF4349 domain-containing protein [Planctomycetaceae bacterium]
MSHADHEWAKEHLAAHLAGGLNAEERARLESHAASCAECIAELDAARRFERTMDDLFSPVRAKAGLEERIIQKLRFAPMQKPRSVAAKFILAAASFVLCGVLGYVIIEMDQNQRSVGSEVAVQEARVPLSQRDYYRSTPERSANGAPAGPMGGVQFKAPADEELKSVDQLVRQRQLSTAGDLAMKEAAESDHNESLDDGIQRRGASLAAAKGGGAGLGGRAFGGPGAPPPPPPAAAAPSNALALQQEAQKNVYSFRSDAPAQQPADAERFKPGELKQLAGKVEPRSELLAKADERSKDGRMNEKRQQGGAVGADKAAQVAPVTVQDPQPVQRKVIRTGEVEYEIEAFDSSVATISKLVEEEAGYVATVNSDKLPNGKVRGVVVLRCPPERLDTLLLKLRGLGELKSQNIRSQDVGKQYYDLESRLKAARTMEERLLKIIKEGKGEIKDLLLAEKELGEWRTKIETFEGEKRYYDSQISLSTLTVTLSEKEIRSASAVTETERVDTGIEVEDVEKAHKAALAAIAEAKGRVTKSDLKQLAAGQYSALIHFEVAPDAAGPLRDRLKQLGNVARLDITRVQETEGGVKVVEPLKVRQKDTQFFVSIYNLANVTARETVTLSLACNDAEASYKQILARIEKAGGRVITSSLNRQKNDQTTGSLRFEIKAAEADAVLLDIRTAGDVMRLDVLENADTQNVTKSKKGFQVQLFAMGLVEPRETTTLTVASKDVSAAYRALQDA